MKLKEFVFKAVKVFFEAGLAAVLAMLGISVTGTGCSNPKFAECINEYRV